MSYELIDSYASLNTEHELPFYLRSTGYSDTTPLKQYSDGYMYHYICIVLEGKCMLKADTYTYYLSENDGFFIRSFFPFSYQAIGKKCRTQWLSFGGYATPPLLARFNLGQYMIYHNLNTELLSHSLSQMYYNAINDDFPGKLKNSALTYNFLADIYMQSEQGIQDAESSFTNDSFLFAKRYIDQFYMKELSQIEIAAAANISSQHLCRLFKKNLNMTPINYLNHVRINQAQLLLKKTSLSIVTVGERVGFSTPHYFSGTFKRICGKTPSEFRKLYLITANNN